jgi:competence protein ComEA
MLWKKLVRDYLTFSKKDRIGVFALLVMIIMVFFLPWFFKEEAGTALLVNYLLPLADSSINGFDKSPAREYRSRVDEVNPKPELFTFDPNSITAAEWHRLGLSAKTTRTIINYREKGGRFYKPEDLQKVWGMPDSFFKRVKDYIRITPPPNQRPITEKKTSPAKKEIKTVFINEADSSTLEELPGIGPKLSSRIVKYRDRIGGFHSFDQLAEVYGLSDTVLQKIASHIIVSGEIKKININTATRDELRSHPYFTWPMANAFVEYRKQHGLFTDLGQVIKIALVDEIVYQKILPYLKLE